MTVLIILLLCTNGVLVCWAGYYLTVRIYPRLYTAADIADKDYIKSIEDITDNIAQIPINDASVEALREQTADALTDISATFADNKIAVNDSIERAQSGMILLVVATLIQVVIALLQLFHSVSPIG